MSIASTIKKGVSKLASSKVMTGIKSVATKAVGGLISGIKKTGGISPIVSSTPKVAATIKKYAPAVAKTVLNSVITNPLGITGLKQAKSIINSASPYNVSRNQALTNLAKPALTSSQTTASKNSIQGLFSKTVNDGGATGTTNEEIKLPGATAPGNVGDINTMSGASGTGSGGLPGSTMGTNTSGLSVNANASVAGLNARAEDDRAALIEAEKQRALLAEQDRNAESQNWWQDLMGNKKSSQDMLEETRDDMGVDIKARLQEQAADAAEYNVMATQLGQLEAAKNSQILQTNDFLGSRNFLNNMVGKIERNAAPPIYALNAQMSAKAAYMQAKAQNWAEADKLVAQTVEYAMADQKDYLDMMGKMYESHQDSLDRINPIYKDAFNKKYDLLTEQYNQGIADKTEMMNLALKYGINVDPKKDTLATVQQRIIRSGGTAAMDLTIKNKASGDSKPSFSGETLSMTEELATQLESKGFNSSDIINLQNKLEQGYSLKQIAQSDKKVANVFGLLSQYMQKATTGDLSTTDFNKGLNYVLENGTEEEIQGYKTDRAYQAYILNLVANQ